MSEKRKATGIVHFVDAVQHRERFSKRTFVLEMGDPDRPELVQFQCLNAKIDLLDNIQVGDAVTVWFYLNGRAWTNPEGKVIYFNTLSVCQIDRETETQQKSFDAEIVPADDIYGNDDIPF